MTGKRFVVVEIRNFTSQRMPDIGQMEAFFREIAFERCLRQYSWSGTFHKKEDRPPDTWPQFPWITELEGRSSQEIQKQGYLTKERVIEIFKWGTGRRHGPLYKAQATPAEFWCRQTGAAAHAITDIPYPHRLGDREAIENWISRAYLALTVTPTEGPVEGIALTYFSKILRFMCPDKFGACDVGLIGHLFQEGLKDAGGNTLRLAFPRGKRELEARKYAHFCWLLQTASDFLNRNHRLVPAREGIGRKWRAADVEMSLFGLAESRKRRRNCQT